MTPRDFAIQIVQQLQSAGYEALWAGGCVRDELLGLTPKDYDVATNALPDAIRELFGKKRTLPIGAAFGVITVLGPKSAGQIEVATFRRDGGYSDSRHPDSVEFTNAREDALRRDFTINGMFFDPITHQVIDYVDGQADLQRRSIRAIGNAVDRFEEDKLRMLRAIRFAATFDFQIVSDTMVAIEQHAQGLSHISRERIGNELVRMFSHPNRAKAASLLIESKLMGQILPEHSFQQMLPDTEAWEQTTEELKRLEGNEFEPAAFLLLRRWLDAVGIVSGLSSLQNQWRLTNQQRDRIEWIARHWQTLAAADSIPWSKLQRLLIHQAVEAGLQVARAIKGETQGIEFCEARLKWPPEELDPPLLIRGEDLIRMGIKPGPQFKQILDDVRDRQLEGQFQTVEDAIKYLAGLPFTTSENV